MLRRAFGWFVLVMASVVLGQQLNPIVGYVGVALTCLVPPASAFACNHIAACPLRRALNRHTVTAAAT